jgi:hypothetical protein
MLAAMPAQAQFMNASQCLSDAFRAKGMGLSVAKEKWVDKVKSQKGALWSNINIATDYSERCAKNKAKKTICAVQARPCRPDTTVKKQSGIPIIQ